MGDRRVGAVLAVLACAVALAGCSTTISGKPLLGAHVAAPGATGTGPAGAPGTGTQVVDFDLCGLLDWSDLPYDRKGVGGFGPTSDVDESYDQSCSWSANKGEAKGLTQLLFSKQRPIKVKRPTGSYQLDGAQVQLGEISEQRKVVGCVTVLDYAGGRLGIAVDDDDRTFGDPCEQVSSIARLMTKREPA